MIEKLLKLLKIKFAGEIPLKDGTMIRIDGDIVVGASVYVQSPDGEMPLPDGDYELETGEILSVADGKIAAITSPVDTTETPDVIGETPTGEIIPIGVENAVVAEDIIPVEEPIPAEPEIVVDPEIEKLKGIVDELVKRLDDLESKINMRSEIETELRTELDFIKTKTLATELKKSKEVSEAPLSRMDIIKNLKNNK